MPIRTSITLNPLTPRKKALQKKYTSIKFRKPIQMIADVLTQQEKEKANKEFREGMAEEYQASEARLNRAHQRYR